MSKKGFTIIELVVSMVVIAVFVYGAIAIFITAGVKGSSLDTFAVAQSLAEGKLEEVMAQSFTVLTDEAQVSYSGDLSAYSSSVNVDYVAASDLDTVVTGPTGYKRIQVNIGHPDLSNLIQLQSIRSDY
ncbi:hypothetical protein A2291_02560 [candidate division WOR-1 bacterium RIFOXYB2_FULL_42_35]|uniref:Prepilin-type N-terminal cleavage/methylation domain-containing protein n=1 Tax=candidate division WOR-1 bacterium RIFOXYC2_FULL_41_25 TaxID=1802586 RepID=A0A1F4TP75_UNCSA|nr:MAG: hypothetical protein A2247_05465 [candidate division WOR-1 bacterium RIFOXYA2_FULL_41_14]OGC25105.1 MAG: hypothetical protein A2291_02560 [candidate division WOR-1 bacterium RIFOXYB2_FULL_42_35]OGC34505.1 MAG: hypothetical protein A2462_04380 [candidate division WOR-1 bacterium RIFOXYC2_FULL_41_25]